MTLPVYARRMVGEAGEPGPERGDDLFAPPPGTSPRGRRALTVAAWICAVGALALPPLGVVGMVAGTVAHVKGDRLGLAAAVTAGVTTIIGMAVVLGLR